MRLQWDRSETVCFGKDEQKTIRATVVKSPSAPDNPFRWSIWGLPDSLAFLEDDAGEPLEAPPDEWGCCATIEQAMVAAEAALSGFCEEQERHER